MLSNNDIVILIPFPLIPILLLPLPSNKFLQLRLWYLHHLPLTLQRASALSNHFPLRHLIHIKILPSSPHNLTLCTEILGCVFRIILEFPSSRVEACSESIFTGFGVVYVLWYRFLRDNGRSCRID